MGIKSISCAFHISRNTVRKYVRKFQESGLTIEQVLSMSEDKLQDIYTAFLVRLMFVFPAICPREVETRLFYKDKLEFTRYNYGQSLFPSVFQAPRAESRR